MEERGIPLMQPEQQRHLVEEDGFIDIQVLEKWVDAAR